MSDVQIVLDDRARLVMAVLAASQWPALEQKQLVHAVHPHAKQTRHHVQSFAHHPAVAVVNQGLAAGVAVDDYFTAGLRCTWPDFAVLQPLPDRLPVTWGRSLMEFGVATAVADTFWPAHQSAWQEGVNDLKTIFANSQVKAFFGRLRHQPISQKLVIMPNILYPALSPVLATTWDTLYLLLPPPKAVGESPPWPYGEDPGWVMAETGQRLTTHLLADTLAQLDNTQTSLLKFAVTTLLLEQEMDEAEAMAYLLRSKKQHKLPQLPGVVDKLREAIMQESADLRQVVASD